MDPATPTPDDLRDNTRKLIKACQYISEDGDNAAIKASRYAMATTLIEDAAAAGHMLTPRELDAVYADTLEAYRPILAGFLVDLLRDVPSQTERRRAVVAAFPRLAAALPDPRCATAVAHAWNLRPFPVGVNREDARAGVWLKAEAAGLSVVDEAGAPRLE